MVFFPKSFNLIPLQLRTREYGRYYKCRLHAVCKDLEMKNLGKYHDLYLKSDTLNLADVFENVRKMRLKLYHLDPVKFRSAPGLAWQAALKKLK